jgi:pimeloyl-ACP methyl ester carboxylesterase
MAATLVLVPGLNCTRALFEPQIAALGSGREVLLADHSRDDTIAAIAARLLEAAPERFALAGLSMGGYIALEAVRQAPERVSRLALLDTNAIADTAERRQLRERQIALVREGRFGEVVEEIWQKAVHPDRLGEPALRGVYDRMAEETGPETFIRQLQAIMSRRDSRPLLPAIAAPTLVLVGDEDKLTPPEQSREMAALIRGATLVVVPACGHLSTLERPERVNEALRAWLAA